MLDIPFVIVPVDILVGFSELDDPTINKAVYYAYKSSARKQLIPKFQAGATKQKFLELSQAFFGASGWGISKNIQLDDVNKRAVVVVTHSPLARILQGKTSHPCDHYTRAILAAIYSAYFDASVECVETECASLHPGDCTFVLKPLNEFDFTKEETQRQLSLQS